MEKLSEDPGFSALCGKNMVTPAAYSFFLQSFKPWQIRRMNDVLLNTSIKMRKKRFADDREFILDVDSTGHKQYGKQMEGYQWSDYRKFSGLDSLQAYDQYGFQYWMDVRPGATYTANGAAEAIERIFAKVPKNFDRKFRGDSGYCQSDVFNACANQNVSFVVKMPANMRNPILSTVRNWRKSKVHFRDGRKAQIGSTLYRAAKNPRETLRMVVIRTTKKNVTMYEKDRYDYQAWLTNFPESEMKHEEIIEFYRKRGNAENMIRELKNGYDIHHFPCKSLLANRAYGVIAALAYTLMRLQAWNIDGEVPRFSKLIRFRMVFVAGHVVKRGRDTIIRISKHKHKEVCDWLKRKSSVCHVPASL